MYSSRYITSRCKYVLFLQWERALTALIRHTIISCPGIFTYLSKQQIKVHILINTINKRLCFNICLSILICKNRQKGELLENLQNTSKQASKMSLLSILYKQSCVSQNKKVNSRNSWHKYYILMDNKEDTVIL